MQFQDLLNILSDKEIINLKIHYIGKGININGEEFIDIGADKDKVNHINQYINEYNSKSTLNNLKIKKSSANEFYLSDNQTNSKQKKTNYDQNEPYLLNIANGSGNLVYEIEDFNYIITCRHVIEDIKDEHIPISLLRGTKETIGTVAYFPLCKSNDFAIIKCKKNELSQLGKIQYKICYYHTIDSNDIAHIFTNYWGTFFSKVIYTQVKYSDLKKEIVYNGLAVRQTCEGKSIELGDSGSTVFIKDTSCFHGIITSINKDSNLGFFNDLKPYLSSYTYPPVSTIILNN